MASPPSAAYAALHQSAGLFDLGQEEIWELSGEERKTFLNAYNTQDILKLKDYEAAPGAFLTQKGKLVSDALIVSLPEKILLVLSEGFGEKIQRHLSTFLMFAKAELSDAGKKWGHLGIFGPKAGEILQTALKSIGPAVSFAGETLYAVPSSRFGISGWEIFFPASLFSPLSEELLRVGGSAGLVPVPQEILEIVRVESGVPKMGVDMGEENLVAEVGLDEGATSFNKGCYLGQETTARVNTQGHVNRNLEKFKLEGEYRGALPVDIMAGDKKVGQLTSAVDSPRYGGMMGLGVVHRMAWEGVGNIFIKTPEGDIGLHKLTNEPYGELK